MPRVTISPATRWISAMTSSIVANGNSISGNVQMPMLWTSVAVSSSQNSIWDEATRISCGPVRVPGTYEVVRSSGIGKDHDPGAVEIGVASMPPNVAGSDVAGSQTAGSSVLERVGGAHLLSLDVLEKPEVDGRGADECRRASRCATMTLLSCPTG